MDTPYIVCLLDVLGYGDLVKDHSKNIEMIKSIERIFESCLHRIDEFQYRPNESDFTLANKEILKKIKFRIIFDTAVMTMPLSDLPLIHKGFDNNKNTITYVEVFLWWVSSFYLCVTTRLGYFFRGGISVGQHYESVLNNNPERTFVFSQAMVDASRSEKEANSLRILIGDSVRKYLSNICGSSLAGNLFDTCVFKDLDGLDCLDIYHALQNDDKTEKILKDIVNCVKGQIKLNKTEPKIIRKYCCFARYHNKKLSSGLDFPELIINDFDKQC